jgi:4-amino-4-deoxy-L-arabinose transferase-like glycosyltransferase
LLLLFCVIYPPVQRALPIIILLAIVSSGTLFFRLGALPLSGADEPRYARIAQEMHDNGNWVTPSLEGKAWLEKPPLYYWISNPFFSFTRSHETAARLGPAICALITALTVCWLGSIFCSRIAGVLGALILLTSIGFVGFGRSASTDMPFTCFFTLAMAIFAAAVGAAGTSPASKSGTVLLGYVFLGLATLGKGPAALILAAGICLLFWFINEQGLSFRRWSILPGLLVTAAISIPWFWLAFRQNGFSFILTFFLNQNLARYVTDIHHHSQPFYYYMPVALALLFPWSGWLPLLIPKMEAVRNWRQWDNGMLFLACWFVFPVLFFSFSAAKLAGYVLPSLPPLALMLGIRVSQVLDRPARLLRMSASVYLVLSAAMAAAAPFFFQRQYHSFRIGLILSAAIVGPAIIAFWYGMRGSLTGALKVTALQGLLVVIAVAQFAFPVLGAYLSTRDIAYRALELKKADEPIVTYQFFQHSLHYYTGYRISDELKTAESLNRAAETHPTLLVVTNVRGMKELENLKTISLVLLGTQGDLRLLRVCGRPPKTVAERERVERVPEGFQSCNGDPLA